jgi:hypothetical protein
MKREHLVLLLINIVSIVIFGALFLINANYEFIIYVGVIIFFLILIGTTLDKINYTTGALVGLTVWSIMHMAGGGIVVGDGRLYDVILIPLSQKYPIFRYDQLVHAWGFGTSTLVSFCLLEGHLKKPIKSSISLGIVLVMAGLGFGAFNEIVEFAVSMAVPESGVGGYLNTSLDLCSNFVGAIGALFYIRFRYFKDL